MVGELDLRLATKDFNNTYKENQDSDEIKRANVFNKYAFPCINGDLS